MKDLVIVDKEGQQLVIPVAELKKYFAPNATDGEFWMFLGLAQSYNLNPFKREIHFVKYGPKAEIVIGYEVYLKRAENTEKLEWWDVKIEGETAADMKGVFTAKRTDWTQPFRWEVPRSEFDKNQATWKAMPKFMLKKCAIGQGLRLLFPEELGGMPYSPEEINGHTSEQINAASVVDVEFEDVPEPDKVEPDPDERQKALDSVLKTIAGFKTIEALEKWAAKQNIEKSVMKDEINAGLAAMRKELEKPTETPETEVPETPEAPGPGEGSETQEMSEEDQLFAAIRELLEAAGHDATYVENRMHGLKHQKIDALKIVLENEKKRLKNGNGNGKA